MKLVFLGMTKSMSHRVQRQQQQVNEMPKGWDERAVQIAISTKTNIPKQVHQSQSPSCTCGSPNYTTHLGREYLRVVFGSTEGIWMLVS